MTATNPQDPPSPAFSAEALDELVSTVAEDFPAVGLQAGPADVQETLDQLLPSPDSLVMIVPTVSGPQREVFVIMSPTLLTVMGGTDISSLPDLVGRTITELADGDELDLNATRLGTGIDALVGLAVQDDGPGATMMAAGVFAGVDHMGTVGVSLQPTQRVAAAPSPSQADEAEMAHLDLPPVSSGTASTTRAPLGRGLDILSGVEMNVVAELGRARMTVGDLLGLVPGSVIELDRSAGSPIDLLVNGTLIARGEVVVVDEEFGLRISEIVANDEVTP